MSTNEDKKRKHLIQAKRWASNNKDKVRETSRQWYADHTASHRAKCLVRYHSRVKPNKYYCYDCDRSILLVSKNYHDNSDFHNKNKDKSIVYIARMFE